MAVQILSSHSEARWDYDVFLSFRGDTRKNFTDRLYEALIQVQIRTFRDTEELLRGKSISDELRKAIRGSRIYIVVFSKSYASSSWCLDELAEITDNCGENEHHTLFPIFYYVDPSDVRKQSGTFTEAFAEHEKRFHTDLKKMERWRKALTNAGSLSGWDVSSIADGYEGKVMEKIVGQLLHELNQVLLHVAEHPIEIESRVATVKALLAFEKNDVHAVGIHGIGGIGKTTIARAVYNHIYLDFEGSSCLLDIAENAKKPRGLVKLQKRLLRGILKKDVRIDDIHEGIELIRKILDGKRVLVVLDDVDHLNQVRQLLGDLSWFGLGSKIIITTRDEHLLTQLEVEEGRRYMVPPLNESQSLELLSWHAFNKVNPEEGFLKLSIGIVKYVEGLPLALEVIGSLLKKRSYDEWISEINKLHKQPQDDIQKILKISFDSLDNCTKKMFLDIACFFVGMEKDYVMKIFNGCNFFPNRGMKFLIQKSLITIDVMDKLRMHRLIQEMGKNVVREKADYVPKNYSRLWFHEDVRNILSQHMVLNQLKVLNLRNSKSFTKLPNFYEVLYLEVLILEGCTSLAEVHESIGCLKSLIELNLKGCISLTNLLSSIGNLESLKTLDISYCSKIFEWLEQEEDMTALTMLYGNEITTTHRLPFLGLSKNLKTELLGYQPKLSDSLLSCLSCYISCKNSVDISSMLTSISRFCYLEELNLSYCGLSEDNFHIDLESLSLLKRLNLSGNNFHNTPRDISHLSKLRGLCLEEIKTLQSISEVPASLDHIIAFDTPSWRLFSSLSDKEPSPIFSECESHDHLQRLISSPSIDVYHNSMKMSSTNFGLISGDEMEVSIEFRRDFEVHKCGIHLPRDREWKKCSTRFLRPFRKWKSLLHDSSRVAGSPEAISHPWAT